MNMFVTSKKIEAKNTICSGGDNEVESGGASFRLFVVIRTFGNM